MGNPLSVFQWKLCEENKTKLKLFADAGPILQEEELKRWHVFCKQRGLREIHKKVVYNLTRFFKKNKNYKNTIRALNEKKEKIVNATNKIKSAF